MRFRSIALTSATTIVVVLLVLNLTLGDKHVDKPIARLYRLDDPQFTRTMGAMLGPAILAGNRVTTLVNGVEIFPSMLEAIRGARRSITLETYIYWSGCIGRNFAEALAERARSGVKVLVLIDAIGSGEIEGAYMRDMRSAGVQIREYNAPRWSNLGRLNNRTHRKLLVVDGRVAFTGGAGIADAWTGDAGSPAHWRDNHYRLEGPAVAQMQSAFSDNWLQATGTVLHGCDFFPPLEPAGDMSAQVFTASPGGGARSMQMMYLLSIAAASRSVRLAAAYFVPDEVAITMLVAAIERGVKVEILVPGPHIDYDVVQAASRATWGKLLEAGAEIYEYQPTMYHCKVLIVDEMWTSVGSTNFDNRSFVINDEANLNIYDRGFALEQVRIFEHDRTNAVRVTLKRWKSRSLVARLWSAAAGLLSSQL
jgi:cardiolipin synthase